MRTLLKGLCLCCVLLALSGCTSMTGRWTIESVEPASAKAGCPLNTFCLMSDGTYRACAMEGKECKVSTGKYTYDQSAKKLTFTMADGKERVYNAELVDGKMKVWSDEKGKEWTAMLAHGQCCGKACEGGKPCCDAMSAEKCDPAKCPMAKPDTKKPAAKPEPKKPEPKKPAEAKPKGQK
jgi:hypothetical protein